MGFEQQIFQWIQVFSYPAVLVLLLACGFGAPLSEDVIVVIGGAAVGSWGGDSRSLVAMMATVYAGKLIGDVTIFLIGRKLGRRAIEMPRFRRLLTPDRIRLAEQHFAKRGFLTVLFARFLPGLRAPSFFVAGASGLSTRMFVLADGLAAAVSAPLLTWVGYRYGAPVLRDLKIASHWIFLGVFVAGLLVFAWILLRRNRKKVENPQVNATEIPPVIKRRLTN